jgi:transcriptional regulator with XRE-family HTH domain
MTNERAESATMVRVAIAAKVRGAVAEHGKTQREIGEMLGLSQPVVQLRLKGERAFRAEELVLIADGLGVSPHQFLLRPAVPASSGSAA